MRDPRRTLMVLIAGLTAACAGLPVDLPEPVPFGPEIGAYRAPAASDRPPESPRPAPSGVLDLRTALEAALAGNPGLAAASWTVRSAEGRALQSSLHPNPELEIEVEEFGGSGELSGFDAAEYSLVLSQELSLTGKVSKRATVANFETQRAVWEYEAARIEAVTGVTRAFLAVLAAQELAKTARERVRLSDDVLRAVTEQVSAGKSAPIEERRAQVALSLAKLHAARTEAALDSARRRLAEWWGTEAGFTAVSGDLHATRRLPPEDLVRGFLAGNPTLAIWEETVGLHRAGIESAKAEAWPDLTVAGGVKRLGETDETAFVAGLSLPLPVFDRNQGGILEARAEAARAREERRQATVRIQAGFSEAWRGLHLAESEAHTLRDSVLPAAQAAFDASREGFRQGKYGYLHVIDAQRTLFEAKEQLTTALAAYHAAVADVEGLIGRSLSSIEQESRP